MISPEMGRLLAFVQQMAGELETQVRFYRYGAEGAAPPEWSHFFGEALRREDPEYGDYLRLKKKFEG